MKTCAFLTLTALGGASAFAPSQTTQPKVSALSATVAELEAMPGVDLETGKKLVSNTCRDKLVAASVAGSHLCVSIFWVKRMIVCRDAFFVDRK